MSTINNNISDCSNSHNTAKDDNKNNIDTDIIINNTNENEKIHRQPFG